MNKQIVAAFDFDGTITKRDTLLPFLRKYGLTKLTKATCKASLRVGNRNFRNILKETALNDLFRDYSSEEFEADGEEEDETRLRLTQVCPLYSHLVRASRALTRFCS